MFTRYKKPDQHLERASPALVPDGLSHSSSLTLPMYNIFSASASQLPTNSQASTARPQHSSQQHQQRHPHLYHYHSVMESLSNELLVSIASYLPQKDLHALALVSKQFFPIGHEWLYRSPSISASSASFYDDRLASLLRTLVEEPALAKLVQSLEVHPQDRAETFDYSTLLPGQSASNLELLELARPRVTQCAIIGMLLKRMENLEVLHVEMIAESKAELHKYNRDRYDIDAGPILAAELFGKGNTKEEQRGSVMSQIRALQTLKEFRQNGGMYDKWWSSMPSLNTLRFGRECHLFDGPDVSETNTTIKTIEMEVSAWNFQFNYRGKSSGFLGNFKGLKHLILRVRNTVVRLRRSDDTEVTHSAIRLTDGSPDFDAFVGTRLAGVASTLEHLEIIYHDDIKENSPPAMPLKWRIQPATFGFLTQLRTLQVPHALLLGKLAADTTRLPTKLEELCVTHVHQRTGNIWTLLEALVGNYSAFQDLAKVRLAPPVEGRLDSKSYIRARDVLRQNGVDVEVVAGRTVSPE